MPLPGASSPDSPAVPLTPAPPLSAVPPLIVIAGATATGKTRLSLALAEAMGNAEIISADSRQVIRGMDIGTGKVDAETRRRVPHHGLDLADPDEPFTVVDYLRHVRGVLAAMHERGTVAILVGGTGLYLRSVARGLPVADTGRDPTLRAELEARLLAGGLAPLVEELRRTAPGVATATDLANGHRVVRALERVAVAGDHPPPAPVGYPGPALWLGLALEPGRHRAAIDQRAAHQFANGLLEEASSLRGRFDSTPGSFSAVGYREAFAALDGRLTVEEATAATAQRTWAYARRQRTWFRREPDVTWLTANDERSVTIAKEAAQAFLDRLGEPQPPRRTTDR